MRYAESLEEVYEILCRARRCGYSFDDRDNPSVAMKKVCKQLQIDASDHDNVLDKATEIRDRLNGAPLRNRSRLIEEFDKHYLPEDVYRKSTIGDDIGRYPHKPPPPERHWKIIEIPAQRLFEVDRYTLKHEFDWIGYDGQDVKDDFGAQIALFRRKSDNRVFKIAEFIKQQENRATCIYLREL